MMKLKKGNLIKTNFDAFKFIRVNDLTVINNNKGIFLEKNGARITVLFLKQMKVCWIYENEFKKF